MTTKIDPKYNVPGLDRALTIIELLNRNPPGLSVNEISHLLKYPLNSVYRIMTTLERRQYVRKQSGESVYVLSDKFLTLATPVAGEPAFIETAMPHMRDLRDSTLESVFAGVLVGNEGVVLEQCEGLHPFSFRISPGLRFPLHTAAPGKLFLAHIEPRKRDKIMDSLKLEPFTPHTITSKEILEKEVMQAAQNGYAVDYEEEFKGQVCVGSPVLGKNAKLIGSVWVVAPTSRLLKKDIPEIAEKIIQSAEKISQALGNQFRKVA